MTENTDFKTCISCNKELYLCDNFYIKRRSDNEYARYDSNCKKCRNKKNAEYKNRNREKVRIKQREWDRNNSDKISAARRKRRVSLPPEKLLDEHRRNNESHYRLRERRIVEFLEQHGSAPLCGCDCGEKVNFNYKGRPNQFVNGHQNRGRAFDRSPKSSGKDLVPLDKFREFVRTYKLKHDLINDEVARRGGWDPLYLDDVMYNKKRKYGLDKIEVDHFLRRLHGLAAPPTKWQLKQFEISNRRYRSTEPA